jgi:histidinol-phosphate aminotransferase
VKGLIKLNTNENPYPPAAPVLKAMRSAVDERLRLYPNPAADRLRRRLARLHRCRMENIIIGNGSDELLALATRAFVEPCGCRRPAGRRSQSVIQYFVPSYSLYPVLTAIHGARANEVSLHKDFTLPSVAELKRGRAWDFNAALTYVTTPNAPSGRGYRTAELEGLCRNQTGVVILDEAYADFADENAMPLALRHPNVLVSRTFSKAYSLCFQRIGYFVGPTDLIGALHKIRDSYNINGLGQVGAEASLDHLAHYQRRFRAIRDARERTAARLTRLGFETLPSQTNFLLVKPPRFSAEVWQQELRARKILVRWFRTREVRQYLRITIGTASEMNQLVRAVKGILAAGSRATR